MGRPSSAPPPTPAPTPASFVFRIGTRVVLSINRLVHVRWAARATGRAMRAMGLRGGGSSTLLFQGGAEAGHNTLDELFGRRRKLDGRQGRRPWLGRTTRRHSNSQVCLFRGVDLRTTRRSTRDWLFQLNLPPRGGRNPRAGICRGRLALEGLKPLALVFP